VIVLVVEVRPVMTRVLSVLVQVTVPPVVVRVCLFGEIRVNVEEVGTSTANDVPSLATVVATDPESMM
jgi:hypothetical protein